MSGCTTCDGISALLDGNYHVGWGALVVVGGGVLLVLGLIAGVELLYLGIVLLLIGGGILVDTWAHQWYH